MSEHLSSLTRQCQVCFHTCTLAPGQYGLCRARWNQNGKIIPAGYGRIASLALDPIEKKPLAFFHPGSMILSVGGFGCNLSCPFCQNHSISQHFLPDHSFSASPAFLIQQALKLKDEGNTGICFTYNEPLICWEYVRDTFQLARDQGLHTVLVTNGTAQPAVLAQILPLTDAVNIDLKAFTETGYRHLHGDLESVRQAIVLAARWCHLEVTTLIVPGLNDSSVEIESMARFLCEISPDIPWHLTRYFPRWKQTDPPVSIQTMLDLQHVARKYMNHVLLGNV